MVLLIACIACNREHRGAGVSDHQPTTEDRAQAAQVQQRDAVQRVLQVSPEEKPYLDSVVMVIHDRFYAPSAPIRGELHRLGATGTRRYLLVASLPRPGSENVIRFFVAEPGMSISEPSPMSISDAIDRFAVDSIADFDADGSADIGYCLWQGPRGTAGEWKAVGLRDGKWYELAGKAGSPKCTPQAEP